MCIVHQGITPTAVAVAAAQPRDSGPANLPSSVDIERMLRADRTRGAYFGMVASGVAAAWLETTR